MYVALSGGTLLIYVMSQQYNYLMELYTNFTKFSLFTKMHLPSSFILGYVIGLRWMCMHLWMNLIKRTIDIQEEKKNQNLWDIIWYMIMQLWMCSAAEYEERRTIFLHRLWPNQGNIKDGYNFPFYVHLVKSTLLPRINGLPQNTL